MGLRFAPLRTARLRLEPVTVESARAIVAGDSSTWRSSMANHRFDAVFLDLVYLGRLLRPGGIVFLDDYQLPGIARAASFFLTSLGWKLEEVSTADNLHQWAVLRTSAGPDTRPYYHFADF